MAVTAKLRYLRIAPRKARLVADLIRGKSVKEAQTILNFTVKKAAHSISKLLKSAIASAKNDFHLEEANLYVSKITVDEGPKYKRWMPRARGQASQIQKKTSHITLVLGAVGGTERKVERVKETEKGKESKEVTEEGSGKETLSRDSKPVTEKAKPKSKIKEFKPKIEKGIKRVFKRKAF